MKRFYNFYCKSCDETQEIYTEYTQQHICPSCGGVTVKQITAPSIKLEGVTGSFPGAYHSWERKRAEKLAQERKFADS